jgi:hypothetical protein
VDRPVNCSGQYQVVQAAGNILKAVRDLLEGLLRRVDPTGKSLDHRFTFRDCLRGVPEELGHANWEAQPILCSSIGRICRRLDRRSALAQDIDEFSFLVRHVFLPSVGFGANKRAIRSAIRMYFPPA